MCHICSEKIGHRKIFYPLFIGSDSKHKPVPVHSECIRWAMEEMILRKEARGAK